MIMNSQEKNKYRKTKQFKQLRNIKLDEANCRCHLCGVKKPNRYLQVHHINPDKYAEPDEYDWTILLCSACHEYLEAKIKVLNNKKNPDKPLLRALLKPYSTLIK